VRPSANLRLHKVAPEPKQLPTPAIGETDLTVSHISTVLFCLRSQSCKLNSETFRRMKRDFEGNVRPQRPMQYVLKETGVFLSGYWTSSGHQIYNTWRRTGGRGAVDPRPRYGGQAGVELSAGCELSSFLINIRTTHHDTKQTSEYIFIK
jgi:hypothetical protein